MVLKPNPWDLSSFSALTLLFVSFDPWNPSPIWPRDVFGGTLNLAQSIVIDIDKPFSQVFLTSLVRTRQNTRIVKSSICTALIVAQWRPGRVTVRSLRTSNGPVPFLDPTQHRITNNEALHISSEVTCNLYMYWTRSVPCQSDLHWSWTVKAGKT